MKIKNWKHAIKLTLERHQAVIDGKYDNFQEAQRGMSPKDWVSSCPLCEYLWQRDKIKRCMNCLWLKYMHIGCRDVLYNNHPKSIIRLKKWLKLENEEENKHKKTLEEI